MTPDYQTEKRMALKLQAIPLPDLNGKSVLDVGCDMAFWSFLAADRGAAQVTGIDRGRLVRGHQVNLIEVNQFEAERRNSGGTVSFHHLNLGRQWHQFGRFDIVFLFSLYHHVYAACGDHKPIWFWLHRHTKGQLLWEGPVDDGDPVVRANVPAHLVAKYTKGEILAAAEPYFAAEYIGPALHEPTREVWRFTPKRLKTEEIAGAAKDGAGGATKAFLHEDSRRSHEVRHIVGYMPKPGSLNVWCDRPFDWNKGYYRAQLLDVVERGKPNSPWEYRWARLYPVTVNGLEAHAFRFEGEHYNERFVELIAPVKLRDYLTSPAVTLCR
jgi:SAM-dependent methyltransferase